MRVPSPCLYSKVMESRSLSASRTSLVICPSAKRTRTFNSEQNPSVIKLITPRNKCIRTETRKINLANIPNRPTNRRSKLNLILDKEFWNVPVQAQKHKTYLNPPTLEHSHNPVRSWYISRSFGSILSKQYGKGRILWMYCQKLQSELQLVATRNQSQIFTLSRLLIQELPIAPGGKHRRSVTPLRFIQRVVHAASVLLCVFLLNFFFYLTLSRHFLRNRNSSAVLPWPPKFHWQNCLFTDPCKVLKA